MNWFSNGIMNAINECRQEGSLLIVYVKDLSEASVSTNQSWEDQKVQEVVCNCAYVGLQLIKDSVEFNQFSQLFPVFVVPSVFCISPNGEQLSVFNGAADSDQLVTTLKQGFQKLTNVQSTAVPPTSAAEGGSQLQSVDFSEEEDEDGVNDTLRQSTADDEERKQEKIRMYREKMAQKRKEREEEAKEREKSSEVRRRKEGKRMAEARKEQDDRDRQNLIKERQKERAEQERARQEVLAKLEQDRLERQSRQRKTDRTTPTSTTSPATTTAAIVPSVFSAVGSNSSCRIQVKLPGAQSTVFTFEPSATVEDLRSKVAQELTVTSDKVILTCVYPRKELGFDLDDTTFDQHGLVPSGVVIARIKGASAPDKTVGAGGGGVIGLLYSLIQFIIQLLVSIKNGIVGLFSGGSTATTTTDTTTAGARQSERDSGRSRFKRVKADDDADDPNKTYNGNSTQQL